MQKMSVLINYLYLICIKLLTGGRFFLKKSCFQLFNVILLL